LSAGLPKLSNRWLHFLKNARMIPRNGAHAFLDFFRVHRRISVRAEYRQHGNNLFIEPSSPVALGTSGEFKAFRPVAVLKQYSRRDMINLLGRTRSSTEATDWVPSGKRLTMLGFRAHRQQPVAPPGPNVRAKLHPAAWRDGHAGQNGAKPQPGLDGVPCRWVSA